MLNAGRAALRFSGRPPEGPTRHAKGRWSVVEVVQDQCRSSWSLKVHSSHSLEQKFTSLVTHLNHLRTFVTHLNHLRTSQCVNGSNELRGK